MCIFFLFALWHMLGIPANRACCQQASPLWFACCRDMQAISKLKSNPKIIKAVKGGQSVTGAEQQHCHKVAPHHAMETRSKLNCWFLRVMAFMFRSLPQAIRVPCISVPCGHRLQDQVPRGNRRTLGLLVNDDATCYLALVHGRRNQHWQGRSKQSNL